MRGFDDGVEDEGNHGKHGTHGRKRGGYAGKGRGRLALLLELCRLFRVFRGSKLRIGERGRGKWERGEFLAARVQERLRDHASDESDESF